MIMKGSSIWGFSCFSALRVLGGERDLVVLLLEETKPHVVYAIWVVAVINTQRAQYPLIKEYSLNHNMKPLII